MALIKCSECGKVFSDKAPACPNCACPTALIEREVEENVESEKAILKNEKAEVICADKNEKLVELSNDKESLLSFEELKIFAFQSILPYINKELNESVTKVNKGRGDGDVDFYITCQERIIGIRVKIDAYPDIIHVGKLFGENKKDMDYAKDMYEAGYEFAIANIGIGSSDPIRFNRRIFLKEDGYYFNYRNLQFRDYGKLSSIRYSLSEIPEDESWKEIAGFEYQRPSKKENLNSSYLIQRQDPEKEREEERRRKIEFENWDMWRNDVAYKTQISQYYEKYNISVNDIEFYYEMFHYMALAMRYRSDAEELMNYFYNAIDFIRGMFLRDSKEVPLDKVLATLKDLCYETELMKNHEIGVWEITACNYLIYKYLIDESFVRKCISEYRSITDENTPLLGFLNEVMKKEFRENPVTFGYPAELRNRIKKLEAMNCPEYYTMFEAKKSEIRKGMVQFALLHDRVINKKKIQDVCDYNISEMNRYEADTYKIDEFIKDHFDAKLAEPMRTVVEAFVKEMELYRISMKYDIQMIKKAQESGYGFFEFRDAVKESKRKYDEYFASKRVSKI